MEVNRMSHSLLVFLKVRRPHSTMLPLLRQCQTWADWMLWLLCLPSTPLRNSRVGSPPTSLTHRPCVLQPAGPIVYVAYTHFHGWILWFFTCMPVLGEKKIIAYIL